jgi:hypothetical protein
MMGFFKDGTGQLSSMRLTQFLVVFVILLVFVAVNGAAVFAAITTKTPLTMIVDFPVQAVLLVTAVITGKVLQGVFVENKTPAGEPPEDGKHE